MGLNVDACAPVTSTYRVHPVGCEKNKARPVTHCQTVSETVRSMAAAFNVIPFGLLYMRPLQWLLRTKGFSPRGNPFRMIKVTRRCLCALVMWKKPWPSSLMAHQPSGDVGCISCSKEFPSRSQGPPCARPLRQHIGGQHISGLLHK